MDSIRIQKGKGREKRYAAILAAASRLYDTTSYKDITMTAIAEESGLSRPAIYQYYQSKDEIYLELLVCDIAVLRGELMEAIETPCTVSEFAELWAEVLSGHHRLLGLMTVLAVLIEQNASVESLTEFRVEFMVQMVELSKLVAKALPDLSSQQIEEFLVMQAATANGLHPMTNLSDNQRQAALKAGYDNLHGSFKRRYRTIIEYYLKGVLSELGSVST